jgi:cell division transport system ATP-binding protein
VFTEQVQPERVAWPVAEEQAAPVTPPTQRTPDPEPVTVPPAPQGAEGLPDHLNFTANLDLRGLRDDSDRTGEQNVGPTK